LTEGESTCDTENHEEYFITDYEWDDLDLYPIDEYENIYELNSNIELLSELDTHKLKSVAFLLSEGITVDLEDAILRSEDVIVHQTKAWKMSLIAY